MLYWTYAQQYVSGSIYQMGGSTLDSISSGIGSSTGYGPWRFTTTDGDNVALEGEAAVLMIQPKADGTMLTQGGWYQLANYPQGPNLKAGTSCATCTNGWPTTATPAGFNSTAQDKSKRYLYYYSMAGGDPSGNYWNPDGSLHGGTIRDFYTTSSDAAYAFEPLYEGYGSSGRIDGDPGQNGGKYSYTEIDGQQGCFWFEGTHKRGTICIESRIGTTGGNSSNCTTGTHHWYANAGNGFMTVPSVAGFSLGETITGQSSGATTTLNVTVGATNLLVQNTGVTNFSPGETIHGGTSGTNATLTTWTRGTTCSHGCLQVANVTGPQANHFHSAMVIYDPSDLSSNSTSCTAGNDCGGADYSSTVNAYINLQATYGMHAAGEDGQLNGGGANLRVGYFDTSRNYLYLISTLGDDSVGGLNTSLIQVFHIIDSASPAPTWLTWLWSWAPSFTRMTKPPSLLTPPARLMSR